MYTIQNNLLQIGVNSTGAELCIIKGLKSNLDFMWQGDSKIWSSTAPNLFPIIGALKNGYYLLDGVAYSLPKHGIIRHNHDIRIIQHTEHQIVFSLTHNQDTLKLYPFKFEFLIDFTLNNNEIIITHRVHNLDDKPLLFSLGGHPAFKCPVFKDESYADYYLEFEHTENVKTHLINEKSGLISNRTKPILKNSKILPLTHQLFHDDALIFKKLKSRYVTLKSKLHGNILSVNYPDFNYLGIWAKPEGDFVCIEPWLGIADSEDHNHQFKTKEGIKKLDVGKTFKASYTIEIEATHLLKTE